MKNKKALGQVFTPENIVELILDSIGYYGENIINKKIMEPSFGNGAFLTKIVKRLILECHTKGYSQTEIRDILNENIYGVEIDKELYNQTIKNLSDIANSFGIFDVEWNHIVCIDIFEYVNEQKFDYIVGNPPFVRIHNLNHRYKQKIDNLKFSKGMTDMYIIFFDICIDFLKNNGKLGFITPNTYFKNYSQRNFRYYLMKENLLEKIIDFKSTNIFENVSTTSAITILNKCKTNRNFTYYVNIKNHISKNEFSIDSFDDEEKKDIWVFKKSEHDLIKEIKNRKVKFKDICNIQHSLSTNRNDIYM